MKQLIPFIIPTLVILPMAIMVYCDEKFIFKKCSTARLARILAKKEEV